MMAVSSVATSAHVTEQQLVQLAAGQLPPAKVTELEDHVDRCAACNELMIYVAQALSPAPQVGEQAGDPTPGGLHKRYRIQQQIGAGGMGVVYRGFDQTLQREVALKLVRPDLARGADGAQLTERLLAEARTLAALSHPNIVTVFDAGTADGLVFVATELIDGRPLSRWVADDAPELTAVVDVFRQAADGLAAAHAAGVIHRDIKPDNMIIGRDGRVRLVDFGLAACERSRLRTPADQQTAQAATLHALATNCADPATTISAAVIGTPLYLAPEQLRGEPADERSDQFALCLALYEARYRMRPFAGESFAERTENLLAGQLRPVELASPGARALHAVIARGLQPNPADRYPSVTAVRDALRDACPSQAATIGRSWRWPVLGVFAVVLAAALGVGYAQRISPATVAQPAATPTLPQPRQPTTTEAPPTALSLATTAYLEAARYTAGRNGPECLAAFQRADGHGQSPPFQDAHLRAQCLMLAGQCERGTELYRSHLELSGGPNSDLVLEQLRRFNCQTSTGPWPTRLARIRAQAVQSNRNEATAQRLTADLQQVVASAGTDLSDDQRVDVYYSARFLAESQAQFGHCDLARQLWKLGHQAYPVVESPAQTASPRLAACLNADD